MAGSNGGTGSNSTDSGRGGPLKTGGPEAGGGGIELVGLPFPNAVSDRYLVDTILVTATMPARIASGNRSHASTTAARSASSGSTWVAFWIALGRRSESLSVASGRDDGIECFGVDEAATRGNEGF
jgi:hypothetical protein